MVLFILASIFRRIIVNDATVQEFHLIQKMLIVILESNCGESLNEIFHILWSNGLMDSHVLCQDGNPFWSLYTFMPYQNDCITLSHHKMVTFTSKNYTNNMALSIKELYPQKMKSFNNCSLYIAIALNDPLSIPPNISNGNFMYRGIDIEIVTQIAKTLNFDVQYVQSNDGHGHGVIYPNGTVTENLKLV